MLVCTTPLLKCVVFRPEINDSVFFNQLIAQTQNAKEWKVRSGATEGMHAC
jgi:hypothetical protein